MTPQITLKLTAAALAALLLAACTQERSSVPQCDYSSGNLLADPGFNTLEEPLRARAWRYSQHAGDESFAYSAENGTLSFEKTGREPWALLTQSVDTSAIKGKRIEFSAEIKLDLVAPEHMHGFGYGGGLSLLAKKSNRMVLNSSLEHEPHMGVHDWRRVRVVADLPKGTSFLRLGFLHQAGGKFQVRDPTLRTVAAGCETTVNAE